MSDDTTATSETGARFSPDADPDGDLLEELAALPSVHHPTASPDGEEVALYYDVSGRNELHLLDAEAGEHDRVSDGQVPRNARWPVEFDADGDRVYFHLDDAGDEQNDVYAIDRAGEAEPVVEMDGQVALNDVGEDGDTLLVGSSAGGQMNLHVHDLTAGETTRLTDYERAAAGGVLSEDCSRVAFTTNTSEDFENQDVFVADLYDDEGDLRTYGDGEDLETARNLEIGETGAEAGVSDWAGGRLLVSDNTPEYNRVGVYDLDTGEVTWLGDGEYVESPGGFVGEDRALVTRIRRCSVVPVVYDVETGEGRELDVPEGVAATPGEPQLAGERVLVVHTKSDERSSLLAYDLATDEYETLLAPEYGPLDPDSFVETEYFTFESDGVPGTPGRAVDLDPYDELEIEALLYDSGRRPSPLVVNPHGGPRGADFRNFDLYTQFLVSRGYSVLKVNYRGSAGRGREFARRIYDDWGGAEQGDVASGLEHVLETRDWVDEDRVVVFGGSYGGYSAYWQLVQYPELYDAGIAWIGVTDLRDMFENTMPHFRTELMEKNLGTPDENPTIYDERSPVTHVENLSAPLLVVHGVNDRRVPVSQARIFREALEEAGFEEGAGGDFEYVELGEEGHASSDIEQKIRLFRTLDDFLDRRMGVDRPAVADD